MYKFKEDFLDPLIFAFVLGSAVTYGLYKAPDFINIYNSISEQVEEEGLVKILK